jgi:hypothetical protein
MTGCFKDGRSLTLTEAKGETIPGFPTETDAGTPFPPLGFTGFEETTVAGKLDGVGRYMERKTSIDRVSSFLVSRNLPCLSSQIGCPTFNPREIPHCGIK